MRLNTSSSRVRENQHGQRQFLLVLPQLLAPWTETLRWLLGHLTPALFAHAARKWRVVNHMLFTPNGH